MTHSRLQNLLALAIWLVTAAGFAATVFAAGGPATYADDPSRRVIGAAFLAFGIIGAPLMRWLTKSRPGGAAVLKDERDEKIAAQATSAGLIAVVLVVFLGAIALWEGYQEPGCVPVGWMWVLAYTTLVLSNLAPVVVSLALDLGATRRAG